MEQHEDFEGMRVYHEEGDDLIVEGDVESCEGVFVHPWSGSFEAKLVEFRLGEGEIYPSFVISLLIDVAFEPMLLLVENDFVGEFCFLLGAMGFLDGKHSCHVMVLRGTDAHLVENEWLVDGVVLEVFDVEVPWAFDGKCLSELALVKNFPDVHSPS